MLRSSRATYTGPDDPTKELVQLRFFGRCCRCGKLGETIQHRNPRGMGGSSDPAINAPSNLLWVCGDGTRKCHGHMESYRTQARDNGWLVRDGMDPLAVKVLLWDGRWVLLDDKGGWELVDPPEGATGVPEGER